MKLSTFALIGIISCSAASAETVAPFSSDGCVPGFNAQGLFVNEQGAILDGAGWVATADKKVLNAAGEQVYLKPGCAGLGHSFRTGRGLVWILGGAVLVALSAGGSSSTGSTTGTTN